MLLASRHSPGLRTFAALHHEERVLDQRLVRLGVADDQRLLAAGECTFAVTAANDVHVAHVWLRIWNPAGFATPPPSLAQANQPRCPVGRLLVMSNSVGTSSTFMPALRAMT